MTNIMLAGEESLPHPFLTIKKVPDFKNNASIVIMYEINFSFIMLLASRRKKSEIFLCGAFLSCVVDEMFIEVPLLRSPCSTPKNVWLCPMSVCLPACLHVCMHMSVAFKAHLYYITLG